MINNGVTDSLEMGTKLNNYIIQSILGRGAFGITYLALDQDLEHLVAIKEYLPQELAMRDEDNTVHPFPGEKGELFRYGLESFLREARTIAKFRHPNIVSVLTLFRKNETAYMVMEYEKGKTLKHYVKDKNDISEQSLLDIFCPINDGLLSVHQGGYIHRDIKPDNIVIREDNTPVLIDFGTARDTLNSNSDDLTQIFTNGYAPFEQCHPTWAKQGPWTDIYSLGATLYFAITGKRIIAAQLRMLNDPYEPLAQGNKEYSANFLKAIDNALSFQPKERPQNLKEWNSALINAKASIDGVSVVDDSININDVQTLISQPEPLTAVSEKIDDTDIRSIGTIETEKSDGVPSKRLFVAVLLCLVLSAPVIYYFYSFGGGKAENPLSKGVIVANDSNGSMPAIVKKEEEAVKKTSETVIVETKVPEAIKKIIYSTRLSLSKKTLSFSKAIELCDVVNKNMNDVFYKELREVYLASLQKTLSLIPKKDLKEVHTEWVWEHRNNITKNAAGEYKINPKFRQTLLEDQYLYGSLTIESPLVVLAVKIEGVKSTCTNSKPCQTPMKNNTVRSGEKVINFSHEKKKINVTNTINVHPNQNFIVHLSK